MSSAVGFPVGNTSLVARFASNSGLTIRHRDTLVSGKSGAHVYVVDCEGKADGIFILKIAATPVRYQGELSRHSDAERARAFAGKLPEIIASSDIDGQTVLLMRIAGGSRILWRPLAQAASLFSAAYAVVGQTLTPSAPELEPAELDGRALIVAWLDYRLIPEQGGRIMAHAKALLGDQPETAAWFSVGRHTMPNPVAFALGNSEWTIQVRPAVGPMHGDLHSDNIFLQVSPAGDPVDIRLIDFAFYENRKPLFFDHAYLELSLLIHRWEGIAAPSWLDACLRLHQIVTPPREPRLTLEVNAWITEVRSGREAACQRLRAHYPDRSDDLALQFLLAQVAAGLAFVNKSRRTDTSGAGLSHQQHAMGFLWAATALQVMLDLTQRASVGSLHASLPVLRYLDQSSVEHIQSEDEGPPPPPLREGAFRILLLGQDEIGLKDASLLWRVSWNLILDFSPHPRPPGVATQYMRPIRQAWPGQELPDVLQMNGGTYWYHANGRADISDALPAANGQQWRRRYAKQLYQLLEHVGHGASPPHVEVLLLPRGLDPSVWKAVLDRVDMVFGDTLQPMKVARADATSWPDDIDLVALSDDAVCQLLECSAALRSDRVSNDVLMPHRVGDNISLREISPDVCRRVQRDLRLVGAESVSAVPEGRRLGYDFLRGMPIEWAELDRGIDVHRDAIQPLIKEVRAALEASMNATVNLLHHASAGGSTLARRVLWEFRSSFPSLTIEQVSNDTAHYLGEIFQATRLPVLAVLEHGVSDTEREVLLEQLREDNTRVVFLRVARSGRSGDGVLEAELSDKEANRFYEAYVQHVEDDDRRRRLRELRDSRTEERSPFFFGLTAFGVDYIGLERLVSRVSALGEQQRSPLVLLALASLYSPVGMPSPEWDAICPVFPDDEAIRYFLVDDGRHVRVPHALIARTMLRRVARDAELWQADLATWADRLLDCIIALPSSDSERVHKLVESLFVTRDTTSALESDIGANQAEQRKFSALINEVGNVVMARKLLKRLTTIWPDRPHYSVHYVRHLLYEDPQELDEAQLRAEFAAGSNAGSNDSAVIHIRGMCHRLRVENTLESALEANANLTSTSEAIRPSYLAAAKDFQSATELSPNNEHGLVASIQLARTVMAGLSALTGTPLDRALAVMPRWCMDVLSLAEESIEVLRNRPRPSRRAERAMIEWDALFRARIDSAIGALRQAANRHEDPGIRRALCEMLLKKHNGEWHRVPVGDLRTMIAMMERNIATADFRDHDVRRWLRASRALPNFDLATCIERLSEWHQLRPSSVEPAFYLFVFYFVRWLNAPSRPRAFAQAANRWSKECRAHRPLGSRSWSYEWLVRGTVGSAAAHFRTLGFDPIEELRDERTGHGTRIATVLARVSGTLVEYKGPQQASIDLGDGVTARCTPRDRFSRDDEGVRVEVLLSFGYDGLVGWDPQRVPAGP
jgi:hypothetical protein